MTGEIDLNGSVHPIGGLDTKFYGAKKAGVKTALYPKLNQEDLDRALKDDPELVDDTFQVSMVEKIWDILPLVFPSEDQSQFINYTAPNQNLVPDYIDTTTTTLDGSIYLQADKTYQNFRWTQQEGPVSAQIESPKQQKTLVKGLTPGQYTFIFQAKEEMTEGETEGAKVEKTLVLQVTKPPLAKIETKRTVTGCTTVLDGSQSFGIRPDLTFLWEQVIVETSKVSSSKSCFPLSKKSSQPAESDIPPSKVHSPSASKTMVSELQNGTYRFRLTITDKLGRKSSEEVEIEVNIPVANQTNSDEVVEI